MENQPTINQSKKKKLLNTLQLTICITNPNPINTGTFLWFLLMEVIQIIFNAKLFFPTLKGVAHRKRPDTIQHINHSLLGGGQACQNTLDPIRLF